MRAFLGVPHSLSKQLRLAKQITSAALYKQAAGLVHKDIQPETIFLLETDTPEIPGAPDAHAHAPTLRSLGTAFLVGYESVRKDEHTWASALNVAAD
jgi:hypothetical protein